MTRKPTPEEIEFLRPKGCEHEKDWEFICNSCSDNFCDKCFGKNDCFSCEEEAK